MGKIQEFFFRKLPEYLEIRITVNDIKKWLKLPIKNWKEKNEKMIQNPRSEVKWFEIQSIIQFKSIRFATATSRLLIQSIDIRIWVEIDSNAGC